MVGTIEEAVAKAERMQPRQPRAMAALHFELVSPERLLLSADVASVTIPGTEGEMGILPGHAPVLSTLRPGVITVTRETGQPERIFVRGGFAEVNAQGLTVLAETALPMAELHPANSPAISRILRKTSPTPGTTKLAAAHKNRSSI